MYLLCYSMRNFRFGQAFYSAIGAILTCRHDLHVNRSMAPLAWAPNFIVDGLGTLHSAQVFVLYWSAIQLCFRNHDIQHKVVEVKQAMKN
jgi:hypothetical protein